MSDTPSKPREWILADMGSYYDVGDGPSPHSHLIEDVRVVEHSALVAAQAEIERLTLLFKNCDVGAVAGLHLEIERLKTEAKENVEYQTNHANAFKYSFDAKKRQCDELKAELERTQKEMSHRDSIHRIDILEHVRKIQSLEAELERVKEQSNFWRQKEREMCCLVNRSLNERDELKTELEKAKAEIRSARTLSSLLSDNEHTLQLEDDLKAAKSTGAENAELYAKYYARCTELQLTAESYRAILSEIQAEIDRGKAKNCTGCCNGNDMADEELCRMCWRIWIDGKMYLLWDWEETEKRIARTALSQGEK